MAVGHVRPLMPLAARLVARGFDVVWAISGDSSVEVLGFSSNELCLDPPDYVRLVGAHVDALPSVAILGSAPPEHQALVTGFARHARAARAWCCSRSARS